MKYSGIAVVGPSASGKTDAAIAIAKNHSGALICCDTIQLFKGFAIGSGVPAKEELCGLPTLLYGTVPPEQRRVGASEYVVMAAHAAKQAQSEDYLPIVEGCNSAYAFQLTQTIDFAAFAFFALLPHQDGLKQRLIAKFNRFMELGVVDEVKRLLDEGEKTTPAMKRSIIHWSLRPYVMGRRSYPDTVEITIRRWLHFIQKQTQRFSVMPDMQKIDADPANPSKTIERLEELIA
ncbi:hypothetical protein HYU16_03895 [Candidatus Woesearchaeota archaeon]|nr:hypothetical protein [Candidatus Woesearchaeota archaeon]